MHTGCPKSTLRPNCWGIVVVYANANSCHQANGLSPGWGTSIFQTANEINANNTLLTRVDEIQAKGGVDKDWLQKRGSVATTVSIDEEGGEKAAPSDDGVLVDTSSTGTGSRPQSSSGNKKKKGKK